MGESPDGAGLVLEEVEAGLLLDLSTNIGHCCLLAWHGRYRAYLGVGMKAPVGTIASTGAFS